MIIIFIDFVMNRKLKLDYVEIVYVRIQDLLVQADIEYLHIESPFRGKASKDIRESVIACAQISLVGSSTLPNRVSSSRNKTESILNQIPSIILFTDLAYDNLKL
ncbi:hypothetical protein L1987_33740 [Smallanthus sonchifolius]|uniref:Uncharacterized protein n=1 Tax=Smallanthus sonchifolius TaxID=185202 RepID=A0ACB9HSP3_9ASTR|nr:hypothetical protein L1987_33740 [Smallanthus sonchifolius]